MNDENFVGKEFPQNCGDSLLILEKIENSRHYKCKFINHIYFIEARIDKILKGNVNNPQIEVDEFINKLWPQKCGDSLRILEKIPSAGKGKAALFKCEFVKYKIPIISQKHHIIKGEVYNKEIADLNTFIGKKFKQNCGNCLEVLSFEGIKECPSKKIFLYKCKFDVTNTIIIGRKDSILRGEISDKNFIDIKKYPYKSKEEFIKIIKNNFPSKKPTLQELSETLNIAVSTVGQSIHNLELEDFISFYPTATLQEKEIFNYIKNELNIKSIRESIWDILGNYELDIFISNYNLGIEYNGNYWHSELYRKNDYHQEKSLLAQEKGIQLIHIWEWEWICKQDIIKSLIKSKLGIFEKRIFARKCIIKELDYKTYADFCNKNHLQGECGAKVKLGLFYKEELIQVMSFGVPRFTDKYEWEIIRECSKQNYIILGGKEKLWKYFINKYNPSNCLSYCDFSKFTGNSYLKLGFKKERLNKPGFWWVDIKLNQIYLRSPFKHQKMKEAGYLKLYDAGQLVFEWNK